MNGGNPPVAELIDCHTHLGNYRDVVNSGNPFGKVTLDVLISYLNALNIRKAVVLPLFSWNVNVLMPTEYVLEAVSNCPDRLIPFCAAEVREQCFDDRVKRYVEVGCRGFGEHTSKLPIDHELNLHLYRLCGRLEIPILIHLAFGDREVYGAMDSPSLDGLERVVREHSDVDFILHGPGWWSCMSADLPAEAYPKTPVNGRGRTVCLLQSYDNLYGDLSASSGYNALNRDIEFAKLFLRELNRKVLYGTDLQDFFTPAEVHRKLLDSLGLSEEAYQNIYHRNLERLIRP